jgi:hypothetical protein
MSDSQPTNPHAQFALANPVFDPDRQIVQGHFWRIEWPAYRDWSAGLTVNIGME